MEMNLNYSEFISHIIITKKLYYHYILTIDGDDKYYYLFAHNDGILFTCRIDNIDDPLNVVDFETDYKDDANKKLIDEEKTVSVRRELTPDGVDANYQFRSIDIDVFANTGWHEQTFSFPMPIALFSGMFEQKAECYDDEIEIIVLDSVTIGIITQNVNISESTINVSASVMENVKVGYYLNLNDVTNDNILGRVVSINTLNNQITCEFETTNSFNVGAYIKMTIKLTPHIKIGKNGIMSFGKKPGGLKVDSGQIMKLRYKNNDGLAKSFVFVIEYFY